MLIKIQNWLLKPKVWSFMCFVSCIVGLVCFCLSPSFNRLFGKWTWWKILIYVIFSFIMCFAVLFAKAWERSTSTRVEAHIAFFILLITSVYSFFFDKQVNGKPDAYIIFSLASFAIMSLSLSRLSHFGCEVDLLYFFCGVLIVQLMKINLWLVIVGATFSYSLVILRSTLNPSARRGYEGLDIPDDVVIEISPLSQLHVYQNNQTSTSSESRTEYRFIDTNTSVRGLLSDEQVASHSSSVVDSHQEVDVPPENEDKKFSMTQDCSHSQHGNRDSIIARFKDCIKALEKENKNLMETIAKHVGQYLKVIVVNNKDQIIELHADDNLVADALPSEIISNLREAVRMMMAAELKVECCRTYQRCRRKFLKKTLSNTLQVMRELNMVEGDYMMMMEIQCWVKVLNVATKIFFPNERRLCDLVFEGSISNLEKYHVSLGNDARNVEYSLNISLKLVYLITRGDKGHATVPPGGGLHQITSRMFNYFNKVNWKSLSPLFVRVIREIIMELLETCLEAESKIYNNPTLGYVFMLNNWRFIEIAATRPGLEHIFGHDWFLKIKKEFQQNLEHYLRSSWDKIVDILKLDIIESEPNVVTDLMKDKLHSFNQHFDDICNVQSMWVVFDEQLREKIIESIENMLLPEYGTFLARFQEFLGQHAYQYIKYGMFEVQHRLNNNLFLVWESEENKRMLWHMYI